LTDPSPPAACPTVRQALRGAADFLAKAGIEDAPTDARILLCHVLGCDHAALHRHPDRPLSEDRRAALQTLLEQRTRHVPVAYLTGHRGFRDLDLLVDRRVLIPRPETELLAEAVLEYLARVPSPLVADLGTGSGAIGLAIARERPDARVFATDISADALAVARENAVREGLQDRVTFIEGDWEAPLHQAAPPGAWDVLASNPPYISPTDYDALPPDVREHEPRIALFAAGDGLGPYRRIAVAAGSLLKPGGLLALELGVGKAGSVRALVESAGLTAIETRRDYGGIERVLVARRES